MCYEGLWGDMQPDQMLLVKHSLLMFNFCLVWWTTVLGPDLRKILRQSYDSIRIFAQKAMILTQTYDNVNFWKFLQQFREQS